MSAMKVCVLFRPLNSKELSEFGDAVSVQGINSESFIIKDEKEQEFDFTFDRVFYQGSEQADIYEFLALPIVQGALEAINGTIITYGQTGAGKTYSMEGPSIVDCESKKKGLLQRVVDGLFEAIMNSEKPSKYTIKLSMVAVSNSAEALQSLSSGIANRAVGETRILRLFLTKFGKLILVDLAGSEKVEKTGAEGKILEEAKTINQSLTALGKVINAMTSSTQGKPTHIPYRDSKLTRILQDALGGCSQTALLCCCSPSPSNSSESLSTLRFGARAKHIKASVHVSCKEDIDNIKDATVYPNVDESRERILAKLRERMTAEDVQLLEKLLVLEGIFFDPNSVDEIEEAYEDVTSRTISSLHKAVEELNTGVEKMRRENAALKTSLKASEEFYQHQLERRSLCLIL
ncbi:hypothetical protein HAX54_013646 [Datura stramonium]|uniref:Kinesin-like protein n=1 Tax=Datura stramonium TaxID=4076 RepID=A0ABS8TP72_DATST|nr:hypothetical protein [Datura stramonium]